MAAEAWVSSTLQPVLRLVRLALGRSPRSRLGRRHAPSRGPACFSATVTQPSRWCTARPSFRSSSSLTSMSMMLARSITSRWHFLRRIGDPLRLPGGSWRGSRGGSAGSKDYLAERWRSPIQGSVTLAGSKRADREVAPFMPRKHATLVWPSATTRSTPETRKWGRACSAVSCDGPFGCRVQSHGCASSKH